MSRKWIGRASHLGAALSLVSCSSNGIDPASSYSGTSTHLQTVASWMSPQAATGKTALLYVTDTYGNSVHVYDYNSGSPVGTLTGIAYPAGECVNRRGDVYVTEVSGKTSEYRNGGSNPLRVFHPPYGYVDAVGCSVDADGDLAVTQTPISSGGSRVCVYPSGHVTTQCYSDEDCGIMASPSYDDHENLYVEGFYRDAEVCELPKGATQMRTVKITGATLQFPGGVTWDGKELALSDTRGGSARKSTILYQTTEAPSGDLAIVGSTILSDTCNSSYADIEQPFVVGSKNTPVNHRRGTVLLGANSSCSPAPVDFWHYKGGGLPFQAWTESYDAGGVAVSFPPHP